MKTLTNLLFLFCSIGLSAQTFQFTHKLEYGFEVEEEDMEPIYSDQGMEFYYAEQSTTSDGLINLYDHRQDTPFFLYKKHLYPLDIALDHGTEIMDPTSFYTYAPPPVLVQKEWYDEISSTGKKLTFNGIECEIFNLKIGVENKDFEVCIAENHKINNASILNPTEEKNKVNGLICMIKPVDSDEPLILKGIEETQLKLTFSNIEVETKEYQKKIEEIQLEREAELQELEEEVLEEESVESLDVVEDTAEVVIEATEETELDFVDTSSLVPYSSTYKDQKTTLPLDAAIGLLGEENKAWEGLPTYCKDLEAIDLKDKDFELHLKNYTAQVCDMYLYSVDDTAVYFMGTLNEIRKESLYLTEHIRNLKRKDRKKVLTYLKNLD